jgi:hypothetical protein
VKLKPLDLALRYREIFYSGKDPEQLNDILAEDFSFNGPFHTFNTAVDYINSLITDPPGGMTYEIIKTFEDEDSVCIIYQFYKGSVSITMAQLFEVKDNKISSIHLIFDTEAVSK